MAEFIRLIVLVGGIAVSIWQLGASQARQTEKLQAGQLQLADKIKRQEDALQTFISENSTAHEKIIASLLASQDRTIKRDQEITQTLGRVSGVLEVLMKKGP